MSLSENISDPQTTAERFTKALGLIPELAQVEEIIRQSFRSDVSPMREIPAYLLSLGGKRIRPALTLLCAKALGTQTISREILDVAAGIELIHMATLMHDDIIDQSPIRRHKQSPFAKYGTPLTLLSGDFLLTRAFGLCAKLDDTIITATEQACIELVEGEALETPLHVEKHTRESSITIAQRKTASLFRLAAFCAGHLTNAPQATIQALSTFGESLGIAFQMIDDILDITASESTLGKQPGLDLAERKPSIVNVLWLESNDPVAAQLLQAPHAERDADFVRLGLKSLPTSEVMKEAKSLALHYADQAAAALHDALGTSHSADPVASSALESVLAFAIARVR